MIISVLTALGSCLIDSDPCGRLRTTRSAPDKGSVNLFSENTGSEIAASRYDLGSDRWPTVEQTDCFIRHQHFFQRTNHDSVVPQSRFALE